MTRLTAVWHGLERVWLSFCKRLIFNVLAKNRLLFPKRPYFARQKVAFYKLKDGLSQGERPSQAKKQSLYKHQKTPIV